MDRKESADVIGENDRPSCRNKDRVKNSAAFPFFAALHQRFPDKGQSHCDQTDRQIDRKHRSPTEAEQVGVKKKLMVWFELKGIPPVNQTWPSGHRQ
ncbi:hypothetical protein FRY98_02370 [Paenibacillus faecis]|uniref:Uncharacterized protein n=1 Tax=Paenibacillus faecis TaxID=862114 RepID=A0A5D0CXV9_9BACL|nr:hypothetical protein [Paenibacillus faecis]TYA14553.1 hypothetical protein FRY98_02370 [Paenibacillus faecis]